MKLFQTQNVTPSTKRFLSAYAKRLEDTGVDFMGHIEELKCGVYYEDPLDRIERSCNRQLHYHCKAIGTSNLATLESFVARSACVLLLALEQLDYCKGDDKGQGELCVRMIGQMAAEILNHYTTGRSRAYARMTSDQPREGLPCYALDPNDIKNKSH